MNLYSSLAAAGNDENQEETLFFKLCLNHFSLPKERQFWKRHCDTLSLSPLILYSALRETTVDLKTLLAFQQGK